MNIAVVSKVKPLLDRYRSSRSSLDRPFLCMVVRLGRISFGTWDVRSPSSQEFAEEYQNACCVVEPKPKHGRVFCEASAKWTLRVRCKGWQSQRLLLLARAPRGHGEARAGGRERRGRPAGCRGRDQGSDGTGGAALGTGGGLGQSFGSGRWPGGALLLLPRRCCRHGPSSLNSV